MRAFALLAVVGAFASASASQLQLEARDILINQGPNAAGRVLGIFAMCGTNPVDCGQGLCCLSGQTCTKNKMGKTACADPDLSDDKSKPAIVNAAYFGAMINGQHSKPHGTKTAQSPSSPTSMDSSHPTTYSILTSGGGDAAPSPASDPTYYEGSTTYSVLVSSPTTVGKISTGNLTTGINKPEIEMSNDGAHISSPVRSGAVAFVGALAVAIAML